MIHPQIRVLADDLTGALDASVWLFDAGSAVVGWSGPQADLSVLTTDSRDCAEDAVAAVIAPAAEWLLSARLAFLKCDSRLRGNLAVELAALIACRAPRRIVIAPALPAMGRIFHNGRLLCRAHAGDGWTTEPTDLNRELLARGHVCTPRAPQSPDEEGIFLCDARTDADLDVVARQAADDTLWCGSSGLAAALARRDGRQRPATIPINSPVLVLVGTVHPLTLEQMSHLETADPGAICRIGPEAEEGAERRVAAKIAAGRSCLVSVRMADNVHAAAAARIIDRAYARLLAQIPRPSGLMVTGGATLKAVATTLGAQGLRIEGQIAPGVPVSRLVGGRWDDLVVASKSGGFGKIDLFSRICTA